MKQRYCPYCDQKMTSDFYCGGCKRIVLHPYEQDVDYFLNERHPQHEPDCLYHDSESEYPGRNNSGQGVYAGVFQKNRSSNLGTGTGNRANFGSQAAGMRKVFEQAKSQAGRLLDQEDAERDQTYRDQSAKRIMDRVNSERGRKKPLTGVVIIFIIWLIFAIGGNILFAVRHAARNAIYGIEDLFSPSGSGSGDLIGFIDEDSGDLSDDEVLAIGDHCSSFGHYPEQGTDVSGILEQKIKEYGITEWSEDTSGYNYTSGDSSWYEKNYDYAVSRDGTYLGTITIFTDTATDELHGIGASGSDEESFYELADVIGSVMQELGYLGAEESGQDIYKTMITSEDTIIGQSDSGVNAFTTGYGPEIFVSQDQISGSVYDSMEIYAPGYYTDVE